MKVIAPGTHIRFRRLDGKVYTDIVRAVFWQETTTTKGVALVLSNHSWCWASDVIDVAPEKGVRWVG